MASGASGSPDLRARALFHERLAGKAGVHDGSAGEAQSVRTEHHAAQCATHVAEQREGWLCRTGSIPHETSRWFIFTVAGKIPSQNNKRRSQRNCNVAITGPPRPPPQIVMPARAPLGRIADADLCLCRHARAPRPSPSARSRDYTTAVSPGSSLVVRTWNNPTQWSAPGNEWSSTPTDDTTDSST